MGTMSDIEMVSTSPFHIEHIKDDDLVLICVMKLRKCMLEEVNFQLFPGTDPRFLRGGASQAETTDVQNYRSLLKNCLKCMHLHLPTYNYSHLFC